MTGWRNRANQKVVIGIVYVSAMILAGLDSTFVNIALPTIGRDFGLASTSLDIVAVSYLIALAVVIPISGWIGDRFGTKQVLLTAFSAFTIASVACGLAPNLEALVAARTVQGLAGGMMTPLGMAMLFRVVPQSQRVQVAALITIPTALAPVIGPVMGGFFVSELSWRWAFLINLPVGLLAVTFGLLFLKPDGTYPVGRLDVTGFVLAAGGSVGVVYGLSEGARRNWDDPLILTGLIGGVILLVALVITELRVAEPLLNLRLLKDPLFRAANGIVALASIMFVAWLFLMAQYYQNVIGLSALQAGLATVPQAIGVVCGTQMGSRIFYPRFGPRRTIMVGFLNTALCTAGLALIPSEHYRWAWILLFLTGFGLPSVFQSAQAAGFATIDNASTAKATAFYSAQRQVSGAFGVAAVTTVLAVAGNPEPGQTLTAPGPYHLAFGVLACVAALGIPIASRIDDAAAAATIHKRSSGRRSKQKAIAV